MVVRCANYAHVSATPSQAPRCTTLSMSAYGIGYFRMRRSDAGGGALDGWRPLAPPGNAELGGQAGLRL